MPSSYESIIDNLNMRNILILEKTICTLHTKEINLSNLGVIKKKVRILLPKRDFAEVKKNKKELEYV